MCSDQCQHNEAPDRYEALLQEIASIRRELHQIESSRKQAWAVQLNVFNEELDKLRYRIMELEDRTKEETTRLSFI